QQAGYRLEELKERVDAFIDIDAEQISGMLTTAFAIMLPGGGLFKGLALLREAYENNWLGIQETTEQVSAAVKAALQSLDVDGDGLTLTDVLGGVQQSIANFDVNSAAAALEQKIGAIFGGLNTGVASKGFGDTLRRALAGVDLSQSIKDAIDRGWAAIDKLDLGPKAIDFTIAAMNFGTWIATEAGEIMPDALRGAMTAEEGDFGDWLLNEWWPAVFPSAAEFATAVASSAAGILNGLSDAVLAHGAKTREAIIDAIFPREQDMVDGWAVAAGAISPGTPSIDWGAWFDQIDASLQAWIDGGGAGRLGERIVRALYDFMSIETFFGPSDGDEVVAGLFGVLADAIARNDGSVITGAIKNYFSNALKNLWDDWTPDLSGFAKGIQESLSRAFSGGTGGGGKVPGLPSPERPGALSIDWSGLLLNGMDQASTELGAKLGEINAAIAGMVTDATAILMEGGLLLTSWAQGTTALFETMWQGIYESSLMMGQRTGAYLTGPFVGHIEEMRAGAALGLQGVVSEFQPIPLQISGIFGEHDWGSIGRAISYGIAADITSAPIIAAVRAASSSRALKPEQEMGIASPAKVPGRRIGAPIGQGIAVYLIDSLRDAAPSVQRALDNMLPRAPALSFAGSPTALRTTSATAASRTMSDNRQITNHLTLSLPAGTPEAIAERALEMIADGLEGL
ncbi:MAG: hypothetical protein KDD73_14800, partial [Anaerolineales bacterium]|nr:hypothetical protein [Anaerolineales bacterium]